MSGVTKIQWTDRTWNAGIFGCSKVSEGCRNCYAMTMAARIAGAADAREAREGRGALTARQRAYQSVVRRTAGPGGQSTRGSGGRFVPLRVSDGRPVGEWNNTIIVDENDPEIMAPLRARAPARWFVDSMHDWFHPDVPFAHLDRLFAVMALSAERGHVFQVLTKRPERMAEYLTREETVDAINQQIDDVGDRSGVMIGGEFDGRAWPLPNVWLGTSCEDQAAWDERVPHLLRCPAAVRFVSAEPLLGPIDVSDGVPWGDHDEAAKVDWIIVGGESGPGSRPMDPAWARGIRDQCRAAGVSFFMKQMGGRSGHKGAIEDLPEDLRIREFPVGGGSRQP